MLGSMVVFQSCKDDSPDYVVPSYNVGTTTINTDDYTGGGTLKLLYSTDGGETWSESFDNVYRGETFMVKVNNGTEDLSADDFNFDWSGSSATPTSDGGTATFSPVNKNINVVVKVSDVMTLITSHRSTGKFYSIDETSGDTTFLFKATVDGATLREIRGFVYHPTKNLYYASTNASGPFAGKLFTINPATKVATMINANDGNDGEYEVWDAIVNWAVAADDSLVAIGDFNGDGNGIVKFGTDGGRGLETIQVDFCCGLGMFYEGGTMWIGTGERTDDMEIEIMQLNEDGTLLGSDIINVFEGFEEDETFVADQWFTLKGLARDDDGKTYGLLFGDDEDITYFVEVDVAGKKITYINKLGESNADSFNTLYAIAKHRL